MYAPDCSNESERRRRRNYPPFIAANKRKLFHQSTCIGQKDWGRGEYVLCFPFFKENEEAARHGVVIIPGRSGQAGIPNNDYRHIRSIDPIWTGIRKGISAALHGPEKRQSSANRTLASTPRARYSASRKAIGSSVSTIWNFITTFRNARTNGDVLRISYSNHAAPSMAPFTHWTDFGSLSLFWYCRGLNAHCLTFYLAGRF